MCPTTAWPSSRLAGPGGADPDHVQSVATIAVLNQIRVSLGNNGCFASVRTRPTEFAIKPGDTLVVRVKGDGREYVLNVFTKSRRMAFSSRAPLPTTSDAWTEVAVPLNEFIPTSFGRVFQGMAPVEPDQINGLGFMLSDKTPGPFKLEVAWLKTLTTDAGNANARARARGQR